MRARLLRLAFQREPRAIACPMMTRAITATSTTVPFPQRRRSSGDSARLDRESAGACAALGPRGFTSSVSYSPLPGIPIVRRTWPFVLTLTLAPGAPTDAASPDLVAVNRNGPNLADRRNRSAMAPPTARLMSLYGAVDDAAGIRLPPLLDQLEEHLKAPTFARRLWAGQWRRCGGAPACSTPPGDIASGDMPSPL